VIPRGHAGSIQTNASVRHPLVAPLSTTTQVGELQVTIDGKQVSSVPLFPTVDVPNGGIWSRLSDTVLLWFQK
jgi:serine-type D-Ala-D-Ala carboxypeptidase (penicillin-binding protein 5/6)